MKLTLYSFNDEDAKKFKEFLNKNNLPFEERSLVNPENMAELRKLIPFINQSMLKVTGSHSIGLYHYNEQLLNLNILEHIKKYKIKLNDKSK